MIYTSGCLVFSVWKKIFNPTESKYGRVFELVLISGSEFPSCEVAATDSIYPYS